MNVIEHCALVIAFSMLACGGERTSNPTSGDAGDAGDVGNADASFDTGSMDATAGTCDLGLRTSTKIAVCASRKEGPGYPDPTIELTLSGAVLATGHIDEWSHCASSASDTQRRRILTGRRIAHRA